MEYLNYSVAIPGDLEFQLPFLEAYKKSRAENLQQEEFIMKKALEATRDTRKNYMTESVIPDTHSFKIDTKNTQLIVRANDKYKSNPNTDQETVKLLIDKTTECLSLKDSILRDVKNQVENTIGNHDRIIAQNEGLIGLFAEIVGKMANTEQYEFDARRVAHAKETISKMLERVSSAITENYKQIDDLIIRILFNLNSDKVDAMKEDTNKVLKTVEEIDARNAQTKRDDVLQGLYEFFKGLLKATHQLRSTYRTSVLAGEIDLIEPSSLTSNALVAYQDNPYSSKIQSIKNKIIQLIEVTVEKIITLRANINSLKMMNSGIAQGAYATNQEISKLFQQIIEDTVNLDSSFYSLILMDVSLLYSLIGKSYHFENRKLFSTIKLAAGSYLEAENSALYLKLINNGSIELPSMIEQFLLKYRVFLAKLHKQNVDKYLLPQFEAETSEMSEDEAYRTVVGRNQKVACKAIDLAVDNLNVFLEELNSGRNRNGINYTLFNREYPIMMYNLSPKLALMEEYKKFAWNAFDPKSWKTDKTRIQNVAQIVYDLAAVESDPTMSSQRKFNTMKDSVAVLRGEVSQFSYIIHSSQKSKPECQEIVKTYVETLKGLWSQVNQEIHDAENIMVQVLRNARVEEGGVQPMEINIGSVQTAHKKQAEIANTTFELLENLTPDLMLAKSREVGAEVDKLQARYNEVARDPITSRAFTMIIQGAEKEFDYNKSVFQVYLPDLLSAMKRLCVCYQGLELQSIRSVLEKNNSREKQTIIRNTLQDQLERDRNFLDSTTYKKAVAHGFRDHPESAKKLELLGQKYYEYSNEATRVADFSISLLNCNSEQQKIELFKEMTRDLKYRNDTYFKQMDNQVVEWLRSVHCPTYNIGMTANTAGSGLNTTQGPPRQQPPAGMGQSIGPSMGQSMGPSAGQSQFNAQNSNFYPPQQKPVMALP